MKAVSKAVAKTNVEQATQMIKILYPHLEKAGVPDVEIQKAMAVAKHLGLDPLKKEVHLVPFGKTVQLVISYLEYVKRGEKSGKLNGWNVRFEGKTKEDLKAVVTIYRKDWQHPLEWTVYFKEAVRNTPSWEQMPLFMLRKVAICQAFRLAFPEETASLPYEEAEIVGEIVETFETKEKEEEEEEEGEEKKEEEEKATEKQLKYLFNLMTEVKLPLARELRLAWASEILGRPLASFAELTKKEATLLIEAIRNKNTEEKEESHV